MLPFPDTFCGLSLRTGLFFASLVCTLFGIINLTAMFVTLEQDSTQGVSQFVHLGAALAFFVLGALLAAAVFWESRTALLLWMALFSAATVFALVAHDMAKFHRFVVDAETVGGLVIGIGLFNIFLNITFLLMAIGYYREINYKKVIPNIPARPVTTL